MKFNRAILAVAVLLPLAGPVLAQVKHYPLESIDGVILHNVAATPAMLDGKKGLRVTMSDEARREQRQVEQLARIKDTEFSNGVIEVELAGAPAPDAPAGARGFVGIAFRLQPDNATYDAFYLRPTNGRADDQERRNHSAQYISHPAWTWSRLRQETPSKYESYVDLVPGAWTKIRIEVRGKCRSALRPRQRAADPHRQRRQVWSAREGGGRAVARFRDSRSLQESNRHAEQVTDRVLAMRTICVMLAWLASSGPASAHHGVANFDLNKEITISGTVTRIDLVNPHSWLFIDVAGDDGRVVAWRCELRGATVLRRSGWSPEMFAAGTKITISGAPDRFQPTHLLPRHGAVRRRHSRSIATARSRARPRRPRPSSVRCGMSVVRRTSPVIGRASSGS